MKRVFGFVLASILFAASSGCGRPPSAPPSQQEKPQPVTRPAIVGVAHIGLRTDNLAAARKFYSGFLGLQEPFTVDDPPGKLLLTYFKVNDHQYIEVFPELKSETEDRLSHIALTTVAQDTQQLTSLAIARAAARLDGTSISERELVVPPHLIIRSTTAPPTPPTSR